MAEISIYGDIVPFKYWGDAEYDLSDLNKALASLDMTNDKELIVNIHTFGGCTVTAFAIYNKLRRFKKENSINLVTRVDGYCASAGVALLLAGDTRIGNAYAEPFVHNAWTWTWEDLDKKKAQKIAEDLTKTDNQIANLYANRTKITVEEALALMDADTWLSAEQCMQYGFFTELEEDVIVADKAEVFNSLRAQRPKKENNTNNNIMSNKKKESILNKINKLLSGTKNLIVFTGDQKELDFYDLVEGDTPGIGDKATYDGKPAGDSNDGTYVMASGETYKFTGEELTEIIPADDQEETVDLVAENAALKEQIDNLKTTEASNKLTIANLKKEVKNAKDLLAELASVEADNQEDEEENPNPQGRQNKNKNDAPLTRNLFANIK